MEAFEEAIAASKEQSLIFKGKRTKRQRPQSPIPFSISPPLVPCLARNIEEASTDLDALNVENRKKEGVITSSSSSASWSSNNNPTYKAEEDQEIANCLILLSQGQLKTPCQERNNNNNNGYRFSSRRFLETSSSNNNGGGYYVYQCKTCDRTFPSFQALGGHRASHKKPKPTSFYSNLDHKNNVSLTICKNNNNNRSLVLYGKSTNNKVHECGICGAEFTSGQALGGHMRRHRGAVVVAPVAPPIVTVATPGANTELSLSSMSFDQISDGQDHPIKRAKNTNVSLDLDLNLLPSPEDENRVNGFDFALKQKEEQEQQEHQQQTKQREEPKSLVLSSPTLVDCYY